MQQTNARQRPNFKLLVEQQQQQQQQQQQKESRPHRPLLLLQKTV
jgi:hypothetical protein